MNLNKTATIKRALALMLTLVMSLSLAACGGVDTTLAADAFNAASARMDEIGEMANLNAAFLGDDFMDEMIAVAEDMSGLRSELESEDITQERADEIQAISEEYLVTVDGFETRIEEALATPLFAQFQTIMETISEISDIHGEAVTLAIDNGWEADDLTLQELNSVAWLLEESQKENYFDEIAVKEESEIDLYIGYLQEIFEAMPALLERVSKPYPDAN